MQNERKSSGINIGSASIIMVFSVLCLTVFAVLTLVTANSEYDIAVKSADSIKDYYSADTLAVEKTAQIKTLISEGDGTFSGISTAAKEIGVTAENSAGGLMLTFSEKVSDNQALAVKLIYTGGELKVQEWKLVNDMGQWNPDEHVELWDGEF